MSGEQGGCFYQPTGVRKATKKKYAIKTTRVQALHNGMTHRPSVLKEGYLLKPSFFRFVSFLIITDRITIIYYINIYIYNICIIYITNMHSHLQVKVVLYICKKFLSYHMFHSFTYFLYREADGEGGVF